jgi:hypothetical protein
LPGAPPGISTEFKPFSPKVFDAEMLVVVVGQWPQETTTQKSFWVVALPGGTFFAALGQLSLGSGFDSY